MVVSAAEQVLDQSVRITEIFYSLQGETKTAGLPTVFVRLTGCPLRCGYCDSEYAFSGGERLTLQAILDQVAQHKTRYVTVTGGEPLAQQACIPLLTLLCDRGYSVSLETSGAISVKAVDARVHKVLDFKTPGSKECSKNIYDNVEYLLQQDQVKFVCCDREDYDWAKQLIEKYDLFNKCEILFSASYQQLQEKQLAEWMLEDQLPARFQIQLHKYLWGDVPGV
ncbi:MAG: 7-carboxy-7-deazaguanine synthase QueE [Gammaproteobacteria bacterium]|nr:7-carboxy-7-deazaguanine synthase QueE [Gammaproteobacteria bacterium]